MATKNRSYGGLALLTALGASLCCITPLLALIAGVGGMATHMAWLEPLRPYLIAATVIVLAFAWYRKLRPVKKDECACEEEKTGFMQSKSFLSIVTLLAVVMLAIPNFIAASGSEVSVDQSEVSAADLRSQTWNISGMTCAGCEQHINSALIDIEGITTVKSSYEEGTTSVEYDESKVRSEHIISAINATGYEVIQ